MPDVALPYSPPLEKALIPNETRIMDTVRALLGVDQDCGDRAVKVTLKMPRVSMNMEERHPGHMAQSSQATALPRVTFSMRSKPRKVTNEYEAPCSGIMLEHLARRG